MTTVAVPSATFWTIRNSCGYTRRLLRECGLTLAAQKIAVEAELAPVMQACDRALSHNVLEIKVSVTGLRTVRRLVERASRLIHSETRMPIPERRSALAALAKVKKLIDGHLQLPLTFPDTKPKPASP